MPPRNSSSGEWLPCAANNLCISKDSQASPIPLSDLAARGYELPAPMEDITTEFVRFHGGLWIQQKEEGAPLDHGAWPFDVSLMIQRFSVLGRRWTSVTALHRMKLVLPEPDGKRYRVSQVMPDHWGYLELSLAHQHIEIHSHVRGHSEALSC